MALRTIKHTSFSYHIEQEDPIRPGETIPVEKKAPRGATVDIPLESDLARGEKFGAFFEGGEQVTPAVEEQAPEEEKTDVSAREMTDEQLVAWIKEDKPRVQDVVDAAEGDPDLARRLLDAEDSATGGDSRQGVIQGLTTIIGRTQ